MIEDRSSTSVRRAGRIHGDRPAAIRSAAPTLFAVSSPSEMASHGTMMNALPHMVWSARADGHIDFHNDQWRNFVGWPHAAIDCKHWISFLHPFDQPAARTGWRQSLITGEPHEAECRLRRHDGEHRWVLCRAVAERKADGSVRRWVGSFTDIHDLKLVHEQSRLVACELTHRLQNIFAVMSAILMLSARTEPQAQSFAKATRARFGALARAHAVISPFPDGAPRQEPASTLQGLLRTLLSPYQDTGPQPRIDIAGDDLPIGKSAAISLALLVHELATNALKHGALSANGGAVRVTTELHETQICLLWTEAGGPAIAGPPARRGFGSALFERALRAPLDARLERIWAANGLLVRLSLPRDRLAR